MINYGFTKTTNESVKITEEKVKQELKKEGFGILTKIDVKEKFKEKLDLDFKEYIILGACNPPNALKAIEAEENIGLMLPCNVIIYEKDNGSAISIIKPSVAMGMINNPKLKETAIYIEQKLKKVLDNI